MAMGISRLLDQNVYFWITSGLTHGIPSAGIPEAGWGDATNIIAGYPHDPTTIPLPTVAIHRSLNRDRPLELGSTTVIRTDTFFASLFCSRDGQRDDLGEYVKRLVDTRSKSFLDFNDGFDPMGGQSNIGTINFEFIGMFPVRELESQTRAGAHRMDIRFDTEYVYDLNS
jgi:hypothetical protein